MVCSFNILTSHYAQKSHLPLIVLVLDSTYSMLWRIRFLLELFKILKVFLNLFTKVWLKVFQYTIGYFIKNFFIIPIIFSKYSAHTWETLLQQIYDDSLISFLLIWISYYNLNVHIKLFFPYFLTVTWEKHSETTDQRAWRKFRHWSWQPFREH